jgi:hypothetical protein
LAASDRVTQIEGTGPITGPKKALSWPNSRWADPSGADDRGLRRQDEPHRQRAGIRRQGWRYGQTALVCAIAHERPHNGVAHQFFMPPGPLAILPLPGNRSSIVWSESEANAARIQAMDDDGYLEVLRPRFGDFLGEIALAGKRWTYPLSLSMTCASSGRGWRFWAMRRMRCIPSRGRG